MNLDSDLIPSQKLTQNGSQKLNVKCKIIKFLEYNIFLGENLDDLGYGDDF